MGLSPYPDDDIAAARQQVREQERAKQKSENSTAAQTSNTQWQFPVADSSQMSQKFGDPDGYHEGHLAEDYRRAAGEDIMAMSDGVVVFAGWASGDNGNVVVLEHTLSDGNKVFSSYSHLAGFSDDITKMIGENAYYRLGVTSDKVLNVKMGEVIAQMGNTGNSTATHLHVAVYKCNTEGYPGAKYTYDPSGYTYEAFSGSHIDYKMEGNGLTWRFYKPSEVVNSQGQYVIENYGIR